MILYKLYVVASVMVASCFAFRHRRDPLHDFGPSTEVADSPFTEANFTQKLDHFGNNTKTFN